MGLDNIPCQYPCLTAGTAVQVTMTNAAGEPIVDDSGAPEQRIDCAATATTGGCPWHNTLGDRHGRVLGLFGAPCWYRGQHGVSILDMMSIDADRMYGDADGELTPAICHSIADDITEWLTDNSIISAGDGTPTGRRATFPDPDNNGDSTDITDDILYLVDWLRWVASTTNGALAWY